MVIIASRTSALSSVLENFLMTSVGFFLPPKSVCVYDKSKPRSEMGAGQGNPEHGSHGRIWRLHAGPAFRAYTSWHESILYSIQSMHVTINTVHLQYSGLYIYTREKSDVFFHLIFSKKLKVKQSQNVFFLISQACLQLYCFKTEERGQKAETCIVGTSRVLSIDPPRL